MRPSLLLPACLSLFLVPAAHAAIPQFDAACGGMIEVHEEDGAIFINGKEAKLVKQGEGSYQATHSGTTVSISVRPNGSVSVSYAGRKGIGGSCNITR